MAAPAATATAAKPEVPKFGMKVTLRIHYITKFGDQLMVLGSPKALGAWNPEKALGMVYNDGTWEATFNIPYNKDGSFEYKYIIRYSDGGSSYESGQNRYLCYHPRTRAKPGFRSMRVEDAWRPTSDVSNVLFSSAFTKVLFRRASTGSAVSALASAPLGEAERAVRLTLRAPRVDRARHMCVIGDAPELGGWDEKRAVVLSDADYPVWKVELPLSIKNTAPVHYKYAVYDTEEKKVITWEDGGHRVMPPPSSIPEGQLFQRNDEHFKYPNGAWRGAGVAIPVFSLRTAAASGVGEFSDLKLFVDWACQVGLRLIQILPVNDTVATHTWTDSYPYAAISVFALHPIYARLSEMGTLKDPKQAAKIEEEARALNALPQVDYERVHGLKSRFFKLLYDQERDNFLADPEYKKFFEENKAWLVPYAAFSCLRDRYGTVDYNWWPKYSAYDEAQIQHDLADPSCAAYNDLAVHYFIQFHLHRQLLSAAEYARQHGVVLKGDLPIGIYRYSVDAWKSPHLYNMHCQTGAPPDAFADDGQNWGFPTYNWEVMAKDGYAWWRTRLSNMSSFFDAFRIDHILGFFRIWEIPYHAIDGMLGQFNPAHPFTVDELRYRGVNFDYDRFCKPYIRQHMLESHFTPAFTAEATAEFLVSTGANMYAIKPQFATQRQVEEYCATRIGDASEKTDYYKAVKKGMFQLIAEVLFLEAPVQVHGQRAFTPRIWVDPENHQKRPWTYRELPSDQQTAMYDTYIHYFYHRQEGLWQQQALKKLPAIKSATDMLVCGEDLGMVPGCVPPTMDGLQILGLNVQRMPKIPRLKFFHPADAPYLSVVTPSSHDTSTVRGWWEENRDLSQAFFHEQLGRQDGAPVYCEPWLVRIMMEQHMHSPAMWSIIPLQDLVGIDEKIRLPDPDAERINVPANPKHYWRYRCHLSVEQLMAEHGFNAELKSIISASGRDARY
jgi:4-alpha-glucanotransferase